MLKSKIILVLVILFPFLSSTAQQSDFEISLQPIVIDGLGGIQSYAFGQHEGQWLIIGGRLDGLHQRQPFAAFDLDGHNNQLIVVDPESQSIWKTSLAPLSASLKEQLGSTNIQFIQEGEYLILTGGYGYSETIGDHITFPYVTVIDIPNLISSIINEEDIKSHFRQQEYEEFAVAGGRLGKIKNSFYLVGGHKFMGRYNPMGPSHGPGFVQEYTYEIRPFNIDLSDDQMNIEFLPFKHDEMNLRRRDYNMQPLISNGEEQLMVYSGVFQSTSDLPWLYPVLINESAHEAIPDFTQHYNHYHCASLPIYNGSDNEMTTIFFGGIAQFYKENDILVQDNDVPFVKTIAAVKRSSDGTLSEYVYPVEMPGYLGAGSEFILNEEITTFNNGCVDSESIKNEPTHIGYIYGGISSTDKNIFWINDGSQSNASSTIYKVYIQKKQTTGMEEQNSDKARKVLLYPNPASNQLRLSIDMPKSESLEIKVFNQTGNIIHKKVLSKTEVKEGNNIFTLNLDQIFTHSTLIVNIRSESINYSQKVIVDI